MFAESRPLALPKKRVCWATLGIGMTQHRLWWVLKLFKIRSSNRDFFCSPNCCRENIHGNTWLVLVYIETFPQLLQGKLYIINVQKTSFGIWKGRLILDKAIILRSTRLTHPTQLKCLKVLLVKVANAKTCGGHFFWANLIERFPNLSSGAIFGRLWRKYSNPQPNYPPQN